MLEHFDEVLLEQYLISENMTKTERDICMIYIMNMKDITDSDIETEDRKFNLNSMRLKKENGCVYFSGEVFNECETRDVLGKLTKEGRSIRIVCDFYRRVGSDYMHYTTVDSFRGHHRKSTYLESGKKFIDTVSLNINDLNNIYRKRIGKPMVLTK